MLETKNILSTTNAMENAEDFLELLFEELHITLATWHKQ